MLGVLWCLWTVAGVGASWAEATSSTGFGDAARYKIRGQVRDSQGQGVAYATILIEPGQVTAMTNEGGWYETFLPVGDYRFQISHLGYHPQLVAWTLNPPSGHSASSGTATRLNGPDIVLKPRIVGLQEVTIKAGTEDPAYGFMRKAIAAAPQHALGPLRYQAETYVKGRFQVVEVPWILRKQLKSNGLEQGVTYVMESASRISYQRPRSFSEKVLSRRSNLPKSMEANLSYSNLNLYEPKAGEWISPLAPNAFRYYRFEYLGSEEEDEERLHRIAVRPRSDSRNFYNGYLVLRSQDWSLARLELNLVNSAGDKFRIGKQFRRIQGISMQFSEDLEIALTFMGASAKIRYISSIRNFKELLPGRAVGSGNGTAAGSRNGTAVGSGAGSGAGSAKGAGSSGTRPLAKAGRKTRLRPKDRDLPPLQIPVQDKADTAENFERTYRFEVDSLADLPSDSLWEGLRTIGLDSSEARGYAVADSLRLKDRKRWLRDSLEAVAPFGFRHLWRGHKRETGKDFPGQAYRAAEWSGLRSGWFRNLGLYNPLEGWVAAVSYRHLVRNYRNANSEWSGHLRWGTRRHTWLPWLEWQQYNAEYRLQVQAGLLSESLGQTRIPNWLNLWSGLMHRFDKPQPSLGMDGKIPYAWAYQGQEGLRSLRFKVNLEQRIHPKARLWLGAGWDERRYWLQSRNTDSSMMWSSVLWPARLSSGSVLVRPNLASESAFQDHQRVLLSAGFRWEPLTQKVSFNGWTRYRKKEEAAVGLDLEQAWTDARPWTKVQGYAQRTLTLGANRRWNGYLGTGLYLAQPLTFADWKHWPSTAYGLGKDEPMAFRGMNPYSLSSRSGWLTLMQEYQSSRLGITRWPWFASSRADESLSSYVLYEPGRLAYGEVGWKLSGLWGGLGLELFHYHAWFSREEFVVLPFQATWNRPVVRPDRPWLRGWSIRGMVRF